MSGRAAARRPLAFAALVLGVLAAGAVVGLLLWPHGEGPAPSADGRPISADTSVSPASHAPGDLVVATLELTLDPAQAANVQVQAGFQPYTRVRPVRVTRVETGGMELARYTYTLQCLDRSCVGRMPDERTARFPDATVSYESPAAGASLLPVEWPELTVSSRLTPGATDDPAFQVAAAPAASYGIELELLGWLLAGGAAALALGTGVAVFLRLRRGRELAPTPAVASGERDPLEQALRALVLARDADEEERRLALDALARSLAAEGLPEEAAARRAAWSREPPETAQIDRLVAAVGKRGEDGET